MGSLYSVSVHGVIVQVLSNSCTAQGIAWSVHGTKFYYVDPNKSQLVEHDFNLESGNMCKSFEHICEHRKRALYKIIINCNNRY